MKRRLAVLSLVIWTQLVGAAGADLSAKVTFTTGSPMVQKIEIIRDGTNFDVTGSYFVCGASMCAVIAQPAAQGTYVYKVRVTDSLGRAGDSPTVNLVIPAAPAPACQGVVVVTTTGTPTAAPTP